MEKDPQKPGCWLLLGRSYTQLQGFQLATRAYQRATGSRRQINAEALIGQAEALAAAMRPSWIAAPGVIEQALALDPGSGKALFFGAAVAMRRGELPLARERFHKTPGARSAGQHQTVLQKQIESIRSAAGRGAPAAGQGPRASHKLQPRRIPLQRCAST